MAHRVGDYPVVVMGAGSAREEEEKHGGSSACARGQAGEV